MKKLLFIILSCSIAGAADNLNAPVQRAVEFNRWYITQINADKYPITDSAEINKFVTADTLKKLRRTQEAGYTGEFYEADFFTKSQYIGADWQQNVAVVAGDVDPVCINVYISFGAKQEHTVIDCMVKENDVWKVQSVAGQEILRNVNLK